MCGLVLPCVEDRLSFWQGLGRVPSYALLYVVRGIVAAPREVAMISTDSVGSFAFLAELLVRGQARHL